jgi:predicted DNA-binding transcriptional regulator
VAIALESRFEIRYILNMQNIARSTLTENQRRFIDDLAATLSVWSLSNNAARLYGYLQIRNDPASLDDIARDLEISRSYAFTAAKQLELYGNARRLSERGSKRVRFIAGEDPGIPLRRQTAALGQMSALIAASTAGVCDGIAAQRLTRLGRFHHDLQAAMEQVIQPACPTGDDANDRISGAVETSA